MRKRILFILLISFLLAACSSAGTPVSKLQTVTPDEAVAAEVTNTTSPTELPPPTETPKAESQPVSTTSQAMAGCTVKSLFPAPDPTSAALFPPVTDADWRRGPKTASVTLIEYSDFQ
jgi:PBP1b-binding outer membrane lipoprotein LpoB